MKITALFRSNKKKRKKELRNILEGLILPKIDYLIVHIIP